MTGGLLRLWREKSGEIQRRNLSATFIQLSIIMTPRPKHSFSAAKRVRGYFALHATDFVSRRPFSHPFRR